MLLAAGAAAAYHGLYRPIRVERLLRRRVFLRLTWKRKSTPCDVGSLVVAPQRMRRERKPRAEQEGVKIS